jgi:SAM-dependent methyltransferase
MTDGTARAHWDGIYGSRDETALTWFEEVPRQSLDLVRGLVGPGDAVIDIGGGRSRLVATLVREGFGPCSLLELSDTALALQQRDLSALAGRVNWIAADITRWRPEARYRLWHDRAVFHFLTDAADRAGYVRALDAALAPGGHAVIATFADTGPERCSGLPVVRYTPEALAAEIDRHAPHRFEAVQAHRHLHATPGGGQQAFQTTVLRRQG